VGAAPRGAASSSSPHLFLREGGEDARGRKGRGAIPHPSDRQGGTPRSPLTSLHFFPRGRYFPDSASFHLPLSPTRGAAGAWSLLRPRFYLWRAHPPWERGRPARIASALGSVRLQGELPRIRGCGRDARAPREEASRPPARRRATLPPPPEAEPSALGRTTPVCVGPPRWGECPCGFAAGQRGLRRERCRRATLPSPPEAEPSALG